MPSSAIDSPALQYYPVEDRLVCIRDASHSDTHLAMISADLKKFGRIRRPFLGLRYLVLNDDLKAKMDQPVNYGAYVIPEAHDPGVTPGSPADKAGLREKDIVLRFGGKKVDTDHPIQDYLEDMKVGQEVRLEVLRGDSKFEVRLKLTERK